MKRAVAIVTAWILLGVGCAGSAEPAAEPRYPEKRRPPPLRSASDGEIMGADGVSPEDRLEASPTNQHPAAGWVVVDGKLVPEKEARQRAAAHERSGFSPEGNSPEGKAESKPGGSSDPDCDPAATSVADATPTSDGRKRKPCAPSPKQPSPKQPSPKQPSPSQPSPPQPAPGQGKP